MDDLGVPPFMETTWNHHIWFGYDIRCSFIPANFFLRVIPALKHYSDRYSFWLYHLKVEMAYLFRHSILHSFWHIPWHSIWHSIRHLCWHLCWHSLWRLAEVKQPPLTSAARGSFTGDDKSDPQLAGLAGGEQLEGWFMLPMSPVPPALVLHQAANPTKAQGVPNQTLDLAKPLASGKLT